MPIAYIGLGSNLAQPIEQIKTALLELDRLPYSRLVAKSSLYQSLPMGPSDQPDYINAVASLDTELDPFELLHELQTLERLHQRVRLQHWGPRTLDLDILLYADQTIETDNLTVPHIGLTERNFVMFPLYEIAPLLRLPNNKALTELMAVSSPQGLQRLESN